MIYCNKRAPEARQKDPGGGIHKRAILPSHPAARGPVSAALIVSIAWFEKNACVAKKDLRSSIEPNQGAVMRIVNVSASLQENRSTRGNFCLTCGLLRGGIVTGRGISDCWECQRKERVR